MFRLVLAALLLTAPLAAASDAAAQEAPRKAGSAVGRTFTGAVLGGWIGYFASHVTVSDWQDRSGVTSYRRTWTAAGLVLGAVVGRLTAPGRPGHVGPVVVQNRRSIEREEIARSGAVNALELVRSVRKDWLIPRGVNSFRETARGSAGFDQPLTVTPGIDHILVYLDNARLGGTQQLAEIGLAPIGRIEFIEGAEATWRWGAGHAHGVILLSSLPLER